MAGKTRRLADLISVGPAMVRDFEILGMRSVGELARRSPERLYEKLCRVAPQHQDICCLDVFRAAGGAGERSAVAGGEMSVVVLEPGEEE
jgi:hypothetical protein